MHTIDEQRDSLVTVSSNWVRGERSTTSRCVTSASPTASCIARGSRCGRSHESGPVESESTAASDFAVCAIVFRALAAIHSSSRREDAFAFRTNKEAAVDAVECDEVAEAVMDGIDVADWASLTRIATLPVAFLVPESVSLELMFVPLSPALLSLTSCSWCRCFTGRRDGPFPRCTLRV